ncbi:MAG: chemotaxis protein CheA [Planctomycetes bacterium]|nr:chemotaxis protein CheA [Planctomycetota bacterium]
MKKKSQAVEALMDIVWGQLEQTEPGDLQSLVTLGEECVALARAMDECEVQAPLAVYVRAVAVVAERIVLRDVTDATAAMDTIRQVLQWTKEAVAAPKKATKSKKKSAAAPPADLLEALKRDSGCAELDAESLAGAGTLLQESFPEPICSKDDPKAANEQVDGQRLDDARETLNDIAMDLSTMSPGDKDGFARVRQRIATLSEEGGLPENAQATLTRILERLDGAATSDGDDKAVSDLGTFFETLQDSLDPNVAPSAAQKAEPAAPAAVAEAPAAAKKPVNAKPPTQAQKAADNKDQDERVRTLVSNAAAEVEAALANDSQLIADFVAESLDHIENSEAALLQMEENPGDTESLNAVFRAFHTIKGTSGFLGMAAVQELAHRAESLLDRARTGKIALTGGYADLILEATDMMGAMIHAIQDSLGGEPFQCADGLDRLLNVLADPEAAGYNAESGAESDPPRIGDLLVAEGKATRIDVEVAAAEQGDRPIGEALVRSSAATTKDVVGALRQQKRIVGKDAESSSVKVRLERLDNLINMVGELVIAHAMVQQDESIRNASGAQLSRNISHMGKIVRELQDLSMSLRMVPLKSTFQKMARLVRDLGNKSRKKVRFLAFGEDTEIDRNMVEVINDPLVHMVRNAVDHGVESAEERVAAGKEAEGSVTLQAYHAAGSVVIDLIDDGKGLDREKLVQKAVSKGLIESDVGMSDTDVFELIFRPGFSTKEQVSEISGRGVGMDVVKRGVDALRGRIELSSVKGQGSTFSMRLPLTLAIIDGMVIRVGTQRYIIPTANIKTTFKPEAESISSVTDRGEMVMFHGELLPVFRLHHLFGIEDAVQDPTEALLVIVEDDGRPVAVMVDTLLGQQQVVVKSLSDGLGEVKGISGGAIMGDGSVGLIIDVQTMVAQARSLVQAWQAAAPTEELATACD